MKKFLIVIVILMFSGCFYQSKEAHFTRIFNVSLSKNTQIINTINPPGQAIVYEIFISQNDFKKLKESTNTFYEWPSGQKNLSVSSGKWEKFITNSMTYSLGECQDGFCKVLVYDPTQEILFAIVADGFGG